MVATDFAARLRVFISYAREDRREARRLYNFLDAAGIECWLDDVRLRGGDDWRMTIADAVRNAHVVLVLLSNASVQKEGYVQKEIRLALDAADEKPEGALYIIPLLLDACGVPSRLQQWHWLDYTKRKTGAQRNKALRELHRALVARASQIGATVVSPTPTEAVRVRRLIPLLKDPDVEQRLAVATSLGKSPIRSKYLTDGLAGAIVADDQRVAIAICQALLQVGIPSSTASKALLDMYGSSSGFVRLPLLEALSKVAIDFQAVKDLVKRLVLDPHYTFGGAVQKLVARFAQEASELLVAWYEEADSAARRNLDEALAVCGPTSSAVVPALRREFEALTAAGNIDFRPVRSVLKALAAVGGALEVSFAAHHPNAIVRREVAIACEYAFGDRLGLLEKFLFDESWIVHRSAAETLAHVSVDEPEAIDLLMRGLTRDDAWSRAPVLVALGRIGAPAAALLGSVIIDSASSDHAKDASIITLGLMGIRAHKEVQVIRETAVATNSRLRCTAIWALSRIAVDAHKPVRILGTSFRRDSPLDQVPHFSIDAATKLRQEALAFLRGLVDDGDEKVRAIRREAISSIEQLIELPYRRSETELRGEGFWKKGSDRLADAEADPVRALLSKDGEGGHRKRP